VPGVQRPNKPVTPPRHGFDVAWVFGGIAKRPPQLIDGGVEAVLEIDEGPFPPDLLAQLLACHHLAGTLEQEKQNGEGLTRQANATAALQQLTGGGVHFERPKREPYRQLIWRRHDSIRQGKSVYHRTTLDEVGNMSFAINSLAGEAKFTAK
jgi:hypothetical protein